jgi:hypothetical protein
MVVVGDSWVLVWLDERKLASGWGCAPPWRSVLGRRAGPVRPACKPEAGRLPGFNAGEGRITS